MAVQQSNALLFCTAINPHPDLPPFWGKECIAITLCYTRQ
jgi:hypothetical protein